MGGYRATKAKATARDEQEVALCTLQSTEHGSKSRVPARAALEGLAGQSAGKEDDGVRVGGEVKKRRRFARRGSMENKTGLIRFQETNCEWL